MIEFPDETVFPYNLKYENGRSGTVNTQFNNYYETRNENKLFQ